MRWSSRTRGTQKSDDRLRSGSRVRFGCGFSSITGVGGGESGKRARCIVPLRPEGSRAVSRDVGCEIVGVMIDVKLG